LILVANGNFSALSVFVTSARSRLVLLVGAIPKLHTLRVFERCALVGSERCLRARVLWGARSQPNLVEIIIKRFVMAIKPADG